MTGDVRHVAILTRSAPRRNPFRRSFHTVCLIFAPHHISALHPKRPPLRIAYSTVSATRSSRSAELCLGVLTFRLTGHYRSVPSGAGRSR